MLEIFQMDVQFDRVCLRLQICSVVAYRNWIGTMVNFSSTQDLQLLAWYGGQQCRRVVRGHVCEGWRDVVGSMPGGMLLYLSCTGDSLPCLVDICDVLDLIWRIQGQNNVILTASYLLYLCLFVWGPCDFGCWIILPFPTRYLVGVPIIA